MITRMNHMSFTVSNLERSVDFYQNTLGLELKGQWTRGPEFSSKVTGIQGASLKIAFMGASNCVVELIEYAAPAGAKIDTRTCNVGSAHVCFNVDDFDVMLKRALAGGAKLAGERTIIPEGNNAGKAVVYFEDPDGNTIEFISNQVLAAAS